MGHYPCCCEPVVCIIASDGFGGGDTTTPPGWTEHVGDWEIDTGVLKPAAATANQRITYDAVTLVPTFQEYIKVRIRGGTGDRLGILFRDDATNYAELTVMFGSGTAGRLNYSHVVAGVETFTWDATNECADNEYDIPPDEWVTLTIRFSSRWTSTLADECMPEEDYVYVNVVLEVDDTAATHTLGFIAPDPLVSGETGLCAVDPSATSEFDDFEIGSLSLQPSTACDNIEHCCLSATADCLGHGSDGWTIVSGSWTDTVSGTGLCPALELIPTTGHTSVSSTNAKRTIDYQWLTDNLGAQVGIGTIVGSEIEWPSGETVWRYFFSIDGTDDWYIEARYNPLSAPFAYLYVSLEHEGVIQAWILFDIFSIEAGNLTTPNYPRLLCDVSGCSVKFGARGPTASAAYWSYDGGAEAEGYYTWLSALSICVDDMALNRTGKVGIGTGSDVDVAEFHNLLVACIVPFECEVEPTTDVPDPDDPGDPTGCCDGYDSLQTGDPIELTLSSWAYWFGAGCDDPGCVDSGFLTAFNATHTLTLVRKDDDRLIFVGNLPENSCDECEGITIRDSVTVRLHNRAVLMIEKTSETECVAKVWIYGRCHVCQWYFESGAFTAGSTDCDIITLTLQSGNEEAAGYQCCLQAGSVSFALP